MGYGSSVAVAAAAPVRPLAQELPYATYAAIKGGGEEGGEEGEEEEEEGDCNRAMWQ